MPAIPMESSAFALGQSFSEWHSHDLVRFDLAISPRCGDLSTDRLSTGVPNEQMRIVGTEDGHRLISPAIVSTAIRRGCLSWHIEGSRSATCSSSVRRHCCSFPRRHPYQAARVSFLPSFRSSLLIVPVALLRFIGISLEANSPAARPQT
jgi:hypothetical protein